MKTFVIALLVLVLFASAVLAAFPVTVSLGDDVYHPEVSVQVSSTTKISTLTERARVALEQPRAPRGQVYRLFVDERCISPSRNVFSSRSTTFVLYLVPSNTICR